MFGSAGPLRHGGRAGQARAPFVRSLGASIPFPLAARRIGDNAPTRPRRAIPLVRVRRAGAHALWRRTARPPVGGSPATFFGRRSREVGMKFVAPAVRKQHSRSRVRAWLPLLLVARCGSGTLSPRRDHGADCGAGCAWLPEPLAIARATSALVSSPCVTPVQASAAGCTAGAVRLMPALWIWVGDSWPWVFGSGKRETPCLRMHCANATKSCVWACCCAALGPLLAPGTS